MPLANWLAREQGLSAKRPRGMIAPRASRGPRALGGPPAPPCSGAPCAPPRPRSGRHAAPVGAASLLHLQVRECRNEW